MSKQFELDPVVQAKAVEAIRESIAALGEADDVQLLLDSVEGETTFFEAVDRILEHVQEDQALIDAIDGQMSNLKARKERFAKRVETNKALIEQAFLVADLPKIQRPLATLYLSNRAPKVVIETESEIPARYWKPQDPKLDSKALGDDLKARRDHIDEILQAKPENRPDIVAAFAQRFLDHEQAQQLRDHIAVLEAAETEREADHARDVIRGNFVFIPGVTLTEASRTLSMRVA